MPVGLLAHAAASTACSNAVPLIYHGANFELSMVHTTVLLLMQLMQDVKGCAQLEGKVTKLSISVDTAILYMHGPLEDQYRKNLPKTLQELLPQPLSESRGCMMTITDPTQQNPIRVRLVPRDRDQMNEM